MTAVLISHHAALRWIERVDPRATMAEAYAAIQAYARVIRIAIAFGARCVRVGCGAKLIIADGVVATVYRRGWMLPRAWEMGGAL